MQAKTDGACIFNKNLFIFNKTRLFILLQHFLYEPTLGSEMMCYRRHLYNATYIHFQSH